MQLAVWGNKPQPKKINKRLRGPPPRGEQVTAAGMPTSCPSPANTASHRHGVRSQVKNNTQIAPGAPPHRAQVASLSILLHLLSVARCIRSPKPVQVIYLRPRIPDDSCRHAYPILSFPVRVPSHPSLIVYSLAGCAFTAFVHDTFSFLRRAGHVFPYRASHMPPIYHGEKITPDSPCQISIFRQLIGSAYRPSVICAKSQKND